MQSGHRRPTVTCVPVSPSSSSPSYAALVYRIRQEFGSNGAVPATISHIAYALVTAGVLLATRHATPPGIPTPERTSRTSSRPETLNLSSALTLMLKRAATSPRLPLQALRVAVVEHHMHFR